MMLTNATEGWIEVVTDEVLQQAIERGAIDARGDVVASAVRYVEALDVLLIGFDDQTAIALPVKMYPQLAAMTQPQLNDIAVTDGGTGLASRLADWDVSISGMLIESRQLLKAAHALVEAQRRLSRDEGELQADDTQTGTGTAKPA